MYESCNLFWKKMSRQFLELPAIWAKEIVCGYLYFCADNLLNRFSRWNFLEQVLSKNDQILDVDDAIAKRCRADVAE